MNFAGIFFGVIVAAAAAGLLLPRVLDRSQAQVQTWIAVALIPFYLYVIFKTRPRNGNGQDAEAGH
ncbi:MAG: hypothetical protein WC728_01545 [Elusimicrobiota bacterium]